MTFLRDFSPLRYPGSKQKLVPYLEQIISFNRLSPELLVEPFVGGGSVFLSFLIKGLVNKVVIADRDPLLFSFWKTIFNDPGFLIDFISRTEVNLKTYKYFKNIAAKPNGINREILACTCLFLNRTSFSGIIAPSSGPIGGLTQSSPYKIDCRFNREALIRKIEYISAFSDQVIVLDFDWKKSLDYVSLHYQKKCGSKHIFYYLDPPFYAKSKDLYRTSFTEKEHNELSLFLLRFKANWVLSYDNASEIHVLYSRYSNNQVHFEIPYSINSHSKRLERELVITPLAIPEKAPGSGLNGLLPN